MEKDNLTTEEIVQLLINGKTVSLQSKEQRKEVQKRLREIKNNCTIVLSQLAGNQ